MLRTRRRFLIAYGLWVFCIFVYFVPGATWNPVSRFDLTRSIVEKRTLSIDGLEESTGDRSFYEGHWYSDKAPIPSLLAVPAYAAAYTLLRMTNHEIHFDPVAADSTVVRIRVNRAFQWSLWACSIATAGLAGALLAVFLFEIIRARAGAACAFVCSTITVLGTPLFPYATSFYGHTIAALFLFVGIAVAAAHAPSRLHVRVAGACIAVAAGCEYLALFPGIAAAVFIASARPRAELPKAVFDLAGGAVIPVTLIAAYHTACFGAPWHTGYSHLVRPAFVEGHARGLLGIHTPRFVALAGLLFGPRRGLFYVAPVALLGAVGLVKAHLADDRASRVAVWTSLIMLFLNAGYYMWWGGAAAGPRHLVPVLPVLAYGFAAVWPSARLRSLLWILGLLSVVVMLSITAVGLEAPESGNVITSYVWPRITHNRIAQIRGASNLGLLIGIPKLASLIPLIGWMGTGVAWFYANCRKPLLWN